MSGTDGLNAHVRLFPVLDGVLTYAPVAALPPVTRERAALQVIDHATDDADCHLLLDMLDLADVLGLEAAS